MRVGDIIQRPEKLNADTFPRLLMFDAQLIYIFDFFRTFEADIFTMLFKNVEQHHFSEAVAGRSMRHT
jgi:hypothetical protein